MFVGEITILYQMTSNDLLQQVDDTAATLLKTISTFNESQLNSIPYEGGWTAGQVADHLFKATQVSMLYQNTALTNRPPGEKIEMIRAIFLDFTTKFISPDFILPSSDDQEKEEVLKHLRGAWINLHEAVQTLDLSNLCLEPELPVFGQLTRLEWIHFILAHTQRHIHQLNKIQQALQQQPSQKRSSI